MEFAAFRARHVQAVRARDAWELVRGQSRWVAEGGRLVEGGAVASFSGRLQRGCMVREEWETQGAREGDHGQGRHGAYRTS